MSITKKFNYKLVKSGNIILTATSDLKGYIVGQAIQLRTDIENKSGRDTGAVVASLLQVGAHWGHPLPRAAAPPYGGLCETGSAKSPPLVLSAFLGKEDLELVLLIPAQSVTQQWVFLLWCLPLMSVLVPV